MAKRDVIIPPHFLGEVSEENKKWFKIYCDNPKAPKTQSYKDKVRKFLEYVKHNKKPLYEFEQADVEIFIEMLMDAGYGGGGIDQFICAISGCARILRKYDPVTFPPSFLSSISPTLRMNEESKSSGDVLTLKQLSLIRKFTLEQDDRVDKFIFEALFRQGVQLEELQSIGKRDLDSSLDYKYKANQYFKKLTEYLKKHREYAKVKNVNAEHFKQSHQAYFFPCPICQKEFENIAENWVLVRTEFDSEYRLVHAACKDRLI